MALCANVVDTPVSLPRPAITELTQPWFNDSCPELWVTASELCELLGYGEWQRRHAKLLLKHAERFGICVWRSMLLSCGRDRFFFRLQLSDLDSIRKLRERRRRSRKETRNRNPVEIYLERNKEHLATLKLR